MSSLSKIIVPGEYDYVGVYLTDKCHLQCSYCITKHHDAGFGSYAYAYLTPDEWIAGLNRLVLPKDVPISLQGGEPFLYKGIKEILEGVHHKVDIMTALPPFIDRDFFLSFKTLDWNNRPAPYPTIRVSYHKGQHDFKTLVDRVAAFNDLVNIGIYYLEHPSYTEEEISAMKRYAAEKGVELRSKEFLGEYQGERYGTMLFPDAAIGECVGKHVQCKNTVVPIAPDGMVYRCHSDLYFNRKELAVGKISTSHFELPTSHLPCNNYGLCSECDVKVKTNHYQQYGYTSVDIVEVVAEVG